MAVSFKILRDGKLEVVLRIDVKKNSRIAQSVPEILVPFLDSECVWPTHELLVFDFLDVAVGELEVADIRGVP